MIMPRLALATAVLGALALPASAAGPGNWPGTYVYEEAIAGAGLEYQLVIKPSHGHALVANLDVDGFQTKDRIACDVKANELKATVTFKANRPGGNPAPYQAGEVLFTLEHGRHGLVTHWGAMKPQMGPRAAHDAGFKRK